MSKPIHTSIPTVHVHLCHCAKHIIKVELSGMVREIVNFAGIHVILFISSWSCDLSGDYDALLVLMLLPRLLFKAELIVEQLRQQHKMDEALGSLSSVSPSQADQLSFASLLVYKLSTLQMLINRANW